MVQKRLSNFSTKSIENELYESLNCNDLLPIKMFKAKTRQIYLV